MNGITTRLAWRWSLALECLFYLRACRNWRKVVQGRLHRGSFERFSLRTGAEIAFDGKPPWHMFDDIWRHQVYSRPPMQLASDPRFVVDIGANIGFFTLYAAARWPNAEIRSYEPAPENYAQLVKNVELSNARNVSCYPFAVMSDSGTTTLYLKEESGWHSTVEASRESVNVPATTLESIVTESNSDCIDLLKLDCEGAEFEILKGRETFLGKHVRQIAMEYHEVGEHTVEELMLFFERAGFRCQVEPAAAWKTGVLYAVNRSDSMTKDDHDCGSEG